MAIVDRIDPATVALLRGHRVDVDPWEQSVAWLYGLDWQPVPVFQDYRDAAARGRRHGHLARIGGAGVSGTEILRTLLFRARQRFLLLNGRRLIRLVPGTAGDGLLMAAAPGVDYPGPFAVTPGARTISFSGLGGPATVRLYSLAVRAAARR